jgi:HEAT repeat protein
MAPMTTHRFFVTVSFAACAMSLGPQRAHGVSRYAPLMASTAGQDSLRNLALWEDQRVTGQGKIYSYLDHGSPLVRRRAVEARPHAGSTDAPSSFRAKDSSKEVVRATVFALGQIGNREAVAPVIAARAGALPEDVGLIGEALGKLGGEEAITELDAMQRDFATQVRAAAALALARQKDPNAANALLLAVHDPDPSVTWRAIYGL